MRAARWISAMAGVGMVFASVARQSVDVPMFVSGLVVLAVLVIATLARVDLLADHRDGDYWRCSCGWEGDTDGAADHVLGGSGVHELIADGSPESPEAVTATVHVTPTEVRIGPIERWEP